ncbi:MAG: Holliday junction resolvase-like protein [archaeon]
MLEIVLLMFVAFLLCAVAFLIKKFFSLKEEIADLKHSKISQSVKYGQLTEQWIPFSKDFPYNPQNFRFIGKPIDGVSFENDKIVFVEFKTNKSHLSETQKNVKELVEKKKIEWLELRAD